MEQHGRTQSCPGWRGVFFDPEGHPGEDHGKDARDVSLDGEVSHPPAQVKVNCHHHVVTCLGTWNKIKKTPVGCGDLQHRYELSATDSPHLMSS